LIQGHVDGAKVNYCLDSKRICQAISEFQEYFDIINIPNHQNCK
jgi:hypothetical protein